MSARVCEACGNTGPKLKAVGGLGARVALCEPCDPRRTPVTVELARSGRYPASGTDVLFPLPELGQVDELDELGQRVTKRGQCENTRRAYLYSWGAWCRWCASSGAWPLPATAASVVNYVGYLDDLGRKVSTVRRHLATIATAHRRTYPKVVPPTAHPGVKAAVKGVANRKRRKVYALTVADLRAMVAALDCTRPAGARDRALLCVGYGGAFRQSELAGLDVGDVTEHPDGLGVYLARSKTDVDRDGHTTKVVRGSYPSTDPVNAWLQWRQVAELEDGPLFRTVNRHRRIGGRMSPEAVGDVVKRAAARAGIDPTSVAGHSLRRGFVTAALTAGAHERDVQVVTRHRDPKSLREYADEIDGWEHHPGKRLF